MLFKLIEIAVLVLFTLCLADALRWYGKNRKKIILLTLAFVYALIFENLNMYLAAGNTGGYFYNRGFTIFVWQLPLFVALAWASLIYTAMHISDMLGLKTLTKPFMDALLVLAIDLTLDVVAVRQHLWTWIGFPAGSGWFGVPPENFVGWLFAVFIFSFLFRYLGRADDDMVNKATRSEWYFLLPAFAYMGMLLLFSLVNLVEDALGLTQAQQIFTVLAIVILFAAMIRQAKKQNVCRLCGDDFTILTIIATRLVFFTYIIWSFVFLGDYMENVVLMLILSTTIIAEVLIYHSAFVREEKALPKVERGAAEPSQ